MKLKEVAVISGKPGLYRILKPTRNGVIIEAIGGGRSKIMADASHRISILQEISVYTTTEEGTVPLQEVFYSIHDKYAFNLDVKTNDNTALKNLLTEILPEWDKSRVYTSDIKKLVVWYNILSEHAPELIDPAQKEEEELTEQERENKEKLENTPEEPVTLSKLETGQGKSKEVAAKEKAMVEAEVVEEKPKKTTKKATTEKKEAKPQEATTKKTAAKTKKEEK